MSDDYNYAVFDMKREEPVFEQFKRQLHAGERAPDFTLEDLATGQPVSLKSLWQGGFAVLEFGSFT